MADPLTELANTLSIEDVPIKLRCVNCSKIAVDAFRLICCASTVCGSCESSLSDSCPQCQFTLTPEIREPHTTLRRTITVWLKTLEKKRAKQQEKPPKPVGTTAVAGLGPQKPVTDATSGKPQLQCACNDPSVREPGSTVCGGCGGKLPDTSKAEDPRTNPPSAPAAAVDAAPSAVGEPDSTPAQEASTEPPQAGATNGTMGGTEADQQQEQGGSVAENKTNGQDSGTNEQQNQMMAGNYNYGMMNNMNGWGQQMAGMDPATMMAMQQNMAGAYGYNMMGMSGMSMDPSMMAQGAYGNYGQGMGMNTANMNAMNMGMGYGGWNGASGGMHMNQMNGANGGHGSYGHYPNGGYIHGNRGRFARQPLPNRHHQNRFRGSGHANWHHGRDQYRNQESEYDQVESHGVAQESFHHQAGQEPAATEEENEAIETVESSDVAAIDPSAPEQQTDAVSRSVGDQDAPEGLSQAQASQEELVSRANHGEAFEQPGDTYSHVDEPVSDVSDLHAVAETDVYNPHGRLEATQASSSETRDLGNVNGFSSGARMEEVQQMGPNVPLGPAAQFAPRGFGPRGRGGFRGGFESRGAMRGRGGATFAAPATTGVVGAPTGPKALREGRPNSGLRGGALRGGRGAMTGPFMTQQRRDSFGTTAPPTGPAADRHIKGHLVSRHVEGQGDREYRDELVSPRQLDRVSNGHPNDENAEDYMNVTHRTSSSRHHSYRGRAESDVEEIDHNHSSRYATSDRHTEKEEYSRRHRSRSPSARAQNHAPNLDLNKRHEKRRRSRSPQARGEDYLSDLEYTGSSRCKSKQESDRHHERNRDDPTSSSRRHSRRDREKDRDRSRSPRREEVIIPTGPAQREFKIHGRSKRSELDVQKDIVREEKPNIDAHALEREARNRERMLKEQQRRGSYMLNETPGLVNGRKRSHAGLEEETVADDDGRERRGRKRKGKGDDRDSKRNRRAKVYDDWDDSNLAAQEQAREAERWE